MRTTYMVWYAGCDPSVFKYTDGSQKLEEFVLTSRSWKDVTSEIDDLKPWLDPISSEDVPPEIREVDGLG